MNAITPLNVITPVNAIAPVKVITPVNAITPVNVITLVIAITPVNVWHLQLLSQLSVLSHLRMLSHLCHTCYGRSALTRTLAWRHPCRTPWAEQALQAVRVEAYACAAAAQAVRRLLLLLVSLSRRRAAAECWSKRRFLLQRSSFLLNKISHGWHIHVYFIHNIIICIVVLIIRTNVDFEAIFMVVLIISWPSLSSRSSSSSSPFGP